MTDLEKLEYIHSTLQDMGHIFGVEDDMLTRSIKHVEELREPHHRSKAMTSESCEREPVYKYWVRQSWWCVNDHTGCLFNDGHNTCAHLGDSLSPLEEQSNDLF